MIGGVFRSGGDVQRVVVDGNALFFQDVSTNMTTTLEGIRFSKGGVIKEFPDLENDEDWRKKAIERLREHIKKMETEKEKIDYVKDELIKFGWTELYFQKKGHRAERWK